MTIVLAFHPFWGPAHDGELGWGGMAGLRMQFSVSCISGGERRDPGILRSPRRIRQLGSPERECRSALRTATKSCRISGAAQRTLPPASQAGTQRAGQRPCHPNSRGTIVTLTKDETRLNVFSRLRERTACRLKTFTEHLARRSSAPGSDRWRAADRHPSAACSPPTISSVYGWDFRRPSRHAG